MHPKLNETERLNLINRVIKGKETISKVCREAGISRVIFYRWLKHYKEAGIASPQKPQGARPQRQVKEEQRTKIIELIRQHPSWSSHKISQILPVSNHGVQNVLKRLQLNTQEKRLNFIKKIHKLTGQQALALAEDRQVSGLPIKPLKLKIVKLTPEKRLEMIGEVVSEHQPVSAICEKYHISRPAFYKWYRRYACAPEERKLQALANKERHVERYWRQTPEKYEEAVLAVVNQSPQYGVQKIVGALPKIAGRPIVGYHGVQRVLERHHLSTQSQRLAYARTQFTPAIKTISLVKSIFERFLTLSPELRQSLVRFIGVTAVTCLITVVILGASGYFATVFHQAPSTNYRIGIMLASFALGAGMLFFAYSAKYYLSLAIVLSFSRHSLDSGGLKISLQGKINGRNGKENNLSIWLKSIFGFNVDAQESPKAEQYQGAGPLQPNIGHIKLKRYPFFSVHLPLYNEKNVAKRLITACMAMDYPGEFEIIVCDDSTDETAEIIKNYQTRLGKVTTLTGPDGEAVTTVKASHKPTLKVIHRQTREGYKGKALSYALKYMDERTEFVSVFDADFVPYADTLKQFIKYFKATGGWNEEKDFRIKEITAMPYSTFAKVVLSPADKEKVTTEIKNLQTDSKIACVAGYQWHVLNKSENWITRGVRTEYAGSYVIDRPSQEILGSLKLIHGSVYCIRADVLKLFDWGSSITEDFELTLRLYAQGFKVVYTPYIQAPSECVATLRRIIRQRMRWAEGHSFNIKKNALKMFFSSKLTFMEKLELLFLSPYYLQAFFFLTGTIAWLLSETVFKARLPFWTSLWGWSLILTNFFALPLMNAVGLFMEESEEKDYLGLLSFVLLSYVLVPFQGYAAVKGFLEPREGPWFRTPKTGKITDVFTRGKFYRWITSLIPGLGPKPAPAFSGIAGFGEAKPAFATAGFSPYLALATANNQFNRFAIVRSKRLPWLAKVSLAILLCFTTSLFYFQRNIVPAYACPWGTQLKLDTGNGDGIPAAGNYLNNTAVYGAGTMFTINNGTAGVISYIWYGNLWPTGADNATIPSGNYYVNIAKSGNCGCNKGNGNMALTMQLLRTSADGSAETELATNTYKMWWNNAQNTTFTYLINTVTGYDISPAAQNRLAVRISLNTGMGKVTSATWFNLLIDNSGTKSSLITPANITVPEIPHKVIYIFFMAIMPVVPALVSGRFRRKGSNIFEEFVSAWRDLLAKLTGIGEEALDELPV